MRESGGEGELIADLRARLLRRGTMPDLPPGWRHQSAMLPASGFEYGGDFIVADISEDGRRLQMVLVDVCGSGETAVPTALQFAGALESLMCAVESEQVLGASNAYLLRQPEEEAFATAVQIVLDLETGEYVIRSAGHPPALRWSPCIDGWQIDYARGTALGVTETPELDVSTGVLTPGDSLLFYTDGVVESRSQHIDTGIAWLQETAANAVHEGWDGAATRIIRLVTRGDDDRAVLLLGRDPEYS